LPGTRRARASYLEWAGYRAVAERGDPGHASSDWIARIDFGDGWIIIGGFATRGDAESWTETHFLREWHRHRR
jgi:antibiotic biosynthesis monooxygenase (ABM) superfamily enzyme